MSQLPSSPETPSAAPPVAAEAGSVQQIRDILFGGQIKDYQHRFQTLEERLGQQAAELGEAFQKRAASLAEEAARACAVVSGELAHERAERAEKDRALAQRLEEVAHGLKEIPRHFDQAFGQVYEAIERAKSELLQHLAEQVTQILEGSRVRQEEYAAAVERQIDALRQTKADRALLGDLLSEISVRLNAYHPHGS